MAELKPRISSGINESSIPTSHYYGPDYTGTAPELYTGNPGMSSFGLTFAPGFVFDNNSGAQTWPALTQHTVHVTQMGNYYLVNSSNKVIAIPIADWERYGPNVAANRDDLAENFAGWLAATEGHAIEYNKSREFQLFVTKRHEHLADPVLNKYVTDIGYAGPLGDLGKYLSKAETLRQDWNRYLASKEGQELAAQKGNIDGVEYLAVWPVEGVIYAVGKANDGKIVLFRGNNSHDGLVHMAESSRVYLEDIIKVGLGEEAMHIARSSFDKVGTAKKLIAEERATKAELLEFYEWLADSAGSKPELKSLYGKIIRHLEHDIATTEQRYGHFAQQQYGSHSLAQLVAEAYANGMETEQEVRDYVAAKAKEASESTGKNSSAGAKSDKNAGKNAKSAANEQKPAENNEGGDKGVNTDSNNENSGGNPEGSTAQESGESAPSSE